VGPAKAADLWTAGDHYLLSFLSLQFNPDHGNWGDWIEERRQALLDASARNPYFKYSLASTVLLLVALGA
jgi:hypothetical protein